MHRWWGSLDRGQQVALIGVLATLFVGLLGAFPAYLVFFAQNDSPTSTVAPPTTSTIFTTTAPEDEPTSTDSFPTTESGTNTSFPTTESSTDRTQVIAIEINWGTDADDYKRNYGMRVSYICPPGGTPQRIWGTDVYTSGSSICTAAVHAGRITLSRGGTVTVVIRYGKNYYASSTRHGITSTKYDYWPSSFQFVS
jgi:hypothetical protein